MSLYHQRQKATIFFCVSIITMALPSFMVVVLIGPRTVSVIGRTTQNIIIVLTTLMSKAFEDYS